MHLVYGISGEGITEEANISENNGDAKPAKKLVNETESGQDESDSPGRSKGIHTPVSAAMHRIAEEASISENMGDRKPANIFAYQLVNEPESGYDESDLPERSKGVYTPVNAAMHRYRTIH